MPLAKSYSSRALVISWLVLFSPFAMADDFFESKIRPVLIKHCYECHAASTDKDSIKGGLRLDWEGGWQTGGDSGPAIAPGKPAESLLLSALKYEDFEMPPSGRLPAAIVDDFETWIARGAIDPRHDPPTAAASAPHNSDSALPTELWSFQPVVVPVVPALDSHWPSTAIDQFVLAKLEEQKLSPIEDAEAGTVLRRLAFDLTGMPPAIDDVARLHRSPSEFCWDDYTEELLQSKAFGEHWARHWLDVARYADSNGGDFNATFHDAWRYRNYVIDAFEHDMPFDQFIVEQLAGDLLPADSFEDRHRQLVATGFLAIGAKMLSERDKDKLQMDVVDEQISTLGTAFLGMTLGCARCHDHKFDPIPTADYYALAGIFKSTHTLEGEIQKYVSNWIRPALPIEPEHAAALAEYAEHLSTLKASIAKTEKFITDQSQGSNTTLTGRGIVIDDSQAELVGQWKSSNLSKPFIGVGYIHDEDSEKGEKSATFRTRLPAAGSYEVWLAYQGSKSRAANVPIAISHAAGIAQVELNEQNVASENKLFQLLGTYSFSADEDARVTISTEGTTGFVIIDAVRFVDSQAEADSKEPAEVQESVALVEAKQQLEALSSQLKELQASAPAPAPVALAAQDTDQIGDCAICIRGEPHLQGEIVPRGFLTRIALENQPSIASKTSGRLELARWIANANHPLTARVYVNRVWNHLVGVGIVASVDNFGQLGERPSHPELLDYLAAEFTRHGWSTKWLVREIVRSHVYRLGSRSDEARESIDPENLLLWRAHRKRLSAESIRDTLLVATGEMDYTGAESPVAELGTLVTQNNPNDSGYTAKSDSKRTLYLPVIRNELPSLMRVFDFADPDYGAGDRSETTVPAQALWMLNGPVVRTQAKQLAAVILEESSQAESRFERLYVRALGRPPTPSELGIGIEFVNQVPPGAEPQMEFEQWTDAVHAVLASSAFRILD